jgi:hypothetical protein
MLIPRTNLVMDLKSRLISIEQPLFNKFKRPTEGWRVRFTIKGMVHDITDSTALRVFNKAMQLFTLNEVEIEPATLWYNMNHQWYSRTRVGKLTNDGALNELAKVGAKDDRQDKLVYHHPKEWGAKGWQWLGLYLAKDDYIWKDFMRQCEEVLELLSPTKNAAIGCIDCYREFASHVARLKNSPIYDKEDARKWLWTIHNSVNKRLEKAEISFSAATKLNHW